MRVDTVHRMPYTDREYLQNKELAKQFVGCADEK